MDRAEAFRTLKLNESAEGQMVQAAYWTLVRQAQDRGRSDIGARRDIDAYNEAYSTLAPGAQLYEPMPAPAPAGPPQGTEFIDRAVDWLGEETLRTRARWVDRNAEIGVVLGVVLFLMIVALSEGASFLIVMAAVVVAVVAIWAPWRKVTVTRAEPPEERDAAVRSHPSTEP